VVAHRPNVAYPTLTAKTFATLDHLSGGRFEVHVLMVSPSGRLIGETEIVVRSTAYNRIALLITIGAALVLLLLWGRRFVPGRARPQGT